LASFDGNALTAGDESSKALGSRYQRDQPIGQGASGEVWRVWDRQDERWMAAKVLWPRWSADPQVLTRFLNERTILTGLDHPNIISVTDLVAEGDSLAIIMELVEGRSLVESLRSSGTFSHRDAVTVAKTVLDALTYAHQRGIVHRDVKPDNILLAQPGPIGPAYIKLADFGIARLTHDGSTPGTETLGTAHYMPPELIYLGKFGAVSDVYSVGVTLYELLAGRAPFQGDGNDMTVGLRHLQVQPPPLPIASDLWDVLAAMLAKDPAKRPSAEQAASALRCLSPLSLTEPPLPVQANPSDWIAARDSLPDKDQVERVLRTSPSRSDEPPNRASPSLSTPDVEHPGDNRPAALKITGLSSRRPLQRVSTADVAGTEPAADAPTDGLRRQLTGHKDSIRHDLHLELERAGTSAPKSRRKWLWFGIAGVGVILATFLALWIAGAFQHNDAAPAADVRITTMPSHLTGDTLPTGLRIDLEAEYDADEEVTVLTVTFAASPASGLKGDLLLTVPGMETGCPKVVSRDGQIEPVRASSDGIDIDCGLKLVDVAVGAGQTTALTLAVGLDLLSENYQVPGDFKVWLENINQTTAEALDRATGTIFPLQRVTGVSVLVDSVTLANVDGTLVPYQVYAEWIGGEERSPHSQIMSQDTVDGMETELLDALTGGAGLDAVDVDTCNQAVRVGIRVLAQQPTDTCHIQVRVGAMDSGRTPFPIAMRR
jgi:serine/threonine-protein kinase